MTRWGPRVVGMATLGATAVLAFAGSTLLAYGATAPLNWGQIGTSVAPPGRQFSAMAYDSVHRRTVMFGGDAITPGSTAPPLPPFGDTWQWDGNSWVQSAPATSPPALTAAAMAFDSARGASVLFGGTNFSSNSNATWEWDGSSWSQRLPSNSPSPRVWAAMAYDSARGRITLFGGAGSSTSQAEAGEYDGSNWIQRFPAASPPARFGEVMAYDTVRHVTVMFGGHNDSGRLNDTWEWDGNNWMQRLSTSVPYPRQFTSMVFDSAIGKTILFGGDHLRPLALGPINDTWAWDGSQWTQDWTDAAPRARLGQSMVYDSARGRTVMFGGTIGGSPNVFPTDTWELGIGIVTPPGAPNAAFVNASGLNPQPYGTTSPPAYALLSSTGTGPLHLASMSITGDFAVASTDCPLAPNPLAAGMICTVAVTFTPTATGSRTGTLTVSDDGSGGGQQITFTGTGTPIATSLTVAQASTTYGKGATLAATLAAAGKPVAGAAVSLTLPNGASRTVQTDTNGVAQWADASTAGIHAGYFFQGVQASYAGDANHQASRGSAPLVVSQLGSLTYAGAFYVTDTTAPAATVIVGQRLPGSDPQFFDFSRLPVYVDIDVSGPGGEFQTTGLVSDAADWSATGNGIATASFPALADGAYVVTARFAPALFPYPGIEFMTGEDARAGLASSPSQRGFAGGGGAIAADPSANTADPHGYFGFELKPGRTLQGNLVYAYRSRIDVGGGTFREVDVIVTSTDLTSLTGNQQTASASGHFSVALIDSLTGVRYGAFEFSGGAFTLNVSDGGTKTANGFALELSRPDGTLFHTSAPLDARGQVPLVPAILGNIACNL